MIAPHEEKMGVQPLRQEFKVFPVEIPARDDKVDILQAFRMPADKRFQAPAGNIGHNENLHIPYFFRQQLERRSAGWREDLLLAVQRSRMQPLAKFS